MAQAFHPSEWIKNHFEFKIHIKFDIENERHNVFVDVYRSPYGSDSTQYVKLLRIGKQFPSLYGVDQEPPKPLTAARRKLLEDV